MYLKKFIYQERYKSKRKKKLKIIIKKIYIYKIIKKKSQPEITIVGQLKKKIIISQQ